MPRIMPNSWIIVNWPSCFYTDTKQKKHISHKRFYVVYMKALQNHRCPWARHISPQLPPRCTYCVLPIAPAPNVYWFLCLTAKMKMSSSAISQNRLHSTLIFFNVSKNLFVIIFVIQIRNYNNTPALRHYLRIGLDINMQDHWHGTASVYYIHIIHPEVNSSYWVRLVWLTNMS